MKKDTINPLNNYVLVSPHNPSYLFVLKQPQLIANSQNYFD